MPAHRARRLAAVCARTAAHSTVTFNDVSSARFVEIGGIPPRARRLADARRAEPCRGERGRDRADAIVLRAAHDGYADRYGILHERTVVLVGRRHRLEGEDAFLAADGSAQVRRQRR